MPYPPVAPSLPRPSRPARSSASLAPSRRTLLRGAAVGVVGLGAGGLLGGCGTTPPAFDEARSAALPPRRGGVLRVGAASGGAADTLDAHGPVTSADLLRIRQLYEPLLLREDAPGGQVVRPAVAAAVEPSRDARSWTVTLRRGLTFHDGRPVRPEDVVFTLRRITDPRRPRAAAALLTHLDRGGLRALDDRTVLVPLTRPDAALPDVLADHRAGVVPEGYDPRRPVGTGPFVSASFEPGRRSVFTRFAGYRVAGRPYLDELHVLDLPDAPARVAALLGGRVDAIEAVPYDEVAAVRSAPAVRLLRSPSGDWSPFTMRVDVAAFRDPRVRQALRLCADREALVAGVLGGYGRVGNDLYAPLDPAYAADLPQRQHDPDRARALLKAAGHDGLRVPLVTAPLAPGLVEAADRFRRQAAGAGVRLDVRTVAARTFYGYRYLSWWLAQDTWSSWPYLVQATLGSQPGAPYNETRWADPTWARLVGDARRTLDEDRRRRLLQDAQHVEWERGGYLVWGFADHLDACSRRLGGLRAGRAGFPLGGYRFDDVWFVR